MPEVLRCLGDAELVECSGTDDGEGFEEELTRRFVIMLILVCWTKEWMLSKRVSGVRKLRILMLFYPKLDV